MLLVSDVVDVNVVAGSNVDGKTSPSATVSNGSYA